MKGCFGCGVVGWGGPLNVFFARLFCVASNKELSMRGGYNSNRNS